MRMNELMERDVVTVGLHEQIGRARALMHQHHIRHLPIVDGKRLVGIVSHEELSPRHLDSTKGLAFFDESPVSMVMLEPASLDSRATARDAANLMRGRKIDCVTIVDEDRLVGIVTAIDLLELLSHHSTPSRIRPITRSREGRH